MRIKLIVAVFFLSWLFLIATPAKADTVLQVDFASEILGQFAPVQTIAGSFQWNRDTHVFSNISIESSGWYTFLPVIFGDRYVEADSSLHTFEGAPIGALFYLSFIDVTGHEGLTLDYNQHPPYDVPIFGPGSYAPEFFLAGDGTPGTTGIYSFDGPGFVTVTEVPVSTPEPKTLLLLIVTGVCLAFFKFKGKAA
jgi:hypothetical protein